MISLNPLRLFAQQMKELLSRYPQGLKLSGVVPEYNQKFKTEFRSENYGKQKLLHVIESITDVVKVGMYKLIICITFTVHVMYYMYCTCNYTI